MPFVRSFGRGPLQVVRRPVCALESRGRGSHQRSARPSLLTRPPTLSSNPQMHSFLSSSLLSLFLSCPPPSPFFPSVVSRRLSARPQRMHRGLFFVSSSFPLSRFLTLSLSYPFFFPSMLSASSSSSRSPRRVPSSSLFLFSSLPPSVYPFSVLSLLTISLRRVLKSIVKPGYKTGQSAGPRNYTRIRVYFPCGCVCARASVPSLLIHEATDAPRDIRLRWHGRERTFERADAHVRVQGMDRRSRTSLFLRIPSFLPSHNPPCLSISPTSRLVSSLSPLSAPVFSFISFFLYPSTTRGVPFLPLVLSGRLAFQR